MLPEDCFRTRVDVERAFLLLVGLRIVVVGVRLVCVREVLTLFPDPDVETPVRETRRTEPVAEVVPLLLDAGKMELLTLVLLVVLE